MYVEEVMVDPEVDDGGGGGGGKPPSLLLPPFAVRTKFIFWSTAYGSRRKSLRSGTAHTESC